MIFASPPEQSLEWSDNGLEGCHKFLKRLWNLSTSINALDEKQFEENKNSLTDECKKLFKKIDFKVSDENAWDVGLACGGEMTVFIEQIN